MVFIRSHRTLLHREVFQNVATEVGDQALLVGVNATERIEVARESLATFFTVGGVSEPSALLIKDRQAHGVVLSGLEEFRSYAPPHALFGVDQFVIGKPLGLVVTTDDLGGKALICGHVRTA